VGQVVFFENDKDTLRLWYHQPVIDTSWQLYIQRDTSVDTVLVKSGLRTAFLTTATLKTAANQPSQVVKLVPGQPLRLRFNDPLVSFAAANIQLLEDTTQTLVQPRLSIDSVDSRNLVVNYTWKEGVKYELKVLPNGVTDLFGLNNLDTVSQITSLALKKDFGTLTLTVSKLDSTKAYVIRLLDKPDGQPVKIWTVADALDFKAKIDLLPPATYTVELIEDLDRNGRWTTGSYDLHRQPERVQRKTLEELRANWELESTVEWTE
jgi:hypothetical protein